MAAEHKQPRPHPIAPTLLNTLSPVVRRLPLGIPQDDPGGMTLWRLWLPTRTGGVIRLSHGGGKDLTLQKPAKQVLATGSTDISHEVAEGTFGEFFVTATGGDGGTLTAGFTQVGWSRESEAKDAAPMLPWNFWYWPSRRGDYFAERAKQVIGRYATARGLSASTFARWEEKNHQDDEAAPWAGHCHNAAPASMLFEQPIAVTIGESPTQFPTNEEELELLATEYFGNFGQLDAKWKLKAENAKMLGSWYLPGYFKPAEHKTRAILLERLVPDLGDRQAAIEKIQKTTGASTTETDFARAVDRSFGEAAAKFYDELITKVRGEGHLLMANARSYQDPDDHIAVWNQVFFYYEATYEETSDNDDDRDITVTCRLFSNLDRYPSGGLPAKVSSRGRVVPGPSGTDCQVYRNVWRIMFTEQGEIDAADARCAWMHLQNGRGQELFAPTSLHWLKKVSRARNVDGLNRLGNPVVGHELLKYLTVRKRYR